MAEIITMPRLSDTMTEGTVAAWLKKVGDKISEGDILAEIETDKATMEFESFYAGTLLYIGVQEGETAAVDSVLAVVGKEGEDYQSLLDGKSTSSSEASKEEEPKEESKKETTAQQPAAEMPEGMEVVTMPRLSDTMTEGTVASWLKKVGDKVSEGDILAEIETDKATMEFESFYAGTLLYIGIQEGESAPVDSILAVIGPEGADYQLALNAGSSSNSSAKKEESKVETEQPKEEKTSATSQEVQSTTNNTQGGRIFASPLAKKIAQEKGIDLSEIKGSGENGRIVKADVENYQPQAKTTSSATSVGSVPTVPSEGVEEVKNSQMRKTIAKRLAESKFTAPHYYLTVELNMDAAIEARKTINNLPDTKVSFNDMVVKACAMALKKHPQVNSQWTETNTIINHDVHVGVAVAVEDGLVVPVVQNTNHMTLTQIGAAVKDLATKARNKKLQPKEMEGSTFTVSNLGMFGIETFTSIINQPNSAILSVGAIVEKPVVKDGAIVVGNTMKVTLACDHRTVDGATGAQFLQTLKQYIENPVTMLA